MAQDELNLSALISSRICHDLISPIGAINNGFELMAMSLDDSEDSPEMALISQSVLNASARIRFFRLAFGAAGDQQIGHTEITSILHDQYLNSRTAVNWDVSEGQPRTYVQLAFLAILCLENAMPYGGSIVVTRKQQKWKITGESEKIHPIPDLWETLKRPLEKNLEASHIQFRLLPMRAAETDKDIDLSLSENEISIEY